MLVDGLRCYCVHMLMGTHMCIWGCAHSCVYVDWPIYVHMVVCTFMCICLWAHICAYGGVHINSKHNAPFVSYSNPQLPNLPVPPTNYVVPYTSAVPDCKVPFPSYSIYSAGL